MNKKSIYIFALAAIVITGIFAFYFANKPYNLGVSSLISTDTGSTSLLKLNNLITAHNSLEATTTMRAVTSMPNLATVGTITSGTWNGTAVGIAYGGTGTTTAPTFGQVLVGNAGGTYDYVATSTFGGSASMIYPDAGIALSTGAGWDTSITNNSANWNTAYTNASNSPYTLFSLLTHDHSTLYDVLGQATSTLGSHTTTYNHTNYNSVYSSLYASGTSGYVLQTNGTIPLWVSTSSLNIAGSGSSGSGESLWASTTADDGIYYNNGNVGIGTTTSINKLFMVASSTTGVSVFDVADSGIVTLGSGATTSMVIDSAGYVGIGTTSPLSILTVYGDFLLEGASRYLNFGTATGSAGYGIRDNGGTIEYKSSGGSWAEIGTGGGGDGIWSTSTIDSNNIYYNSGNVGIGTSTPAYDLEVVGTASFGTGDAVLTTYGGYVGISTATPAYNLDVYGIGRFTGSTTIGNTTISPNTSLLGNVLVSDGTNAYWQATSTLGITGGSTYTATYPITLTGSAFGLAFGTTTANTWSGANTFTSTLTGTLTGNADTATALATNPDACSVGEFVSDIDANGALTCGIPAGGGAGVGWATSSATQLYSTIANVGIGTTTPSALLTLKSTGTTTPALRLINPDNNSIGLEIRGGGSQYGFATGMNSFVGYNSGASVTTGNSNVGLGYEAMDALTSGDSNVAIGKGTMGAVVTGSYNVGIGEQSLGYLTSGGSNMAIGFGSLGLLTTGSYNTGIGYQALFNTSSGSNNIAIGASAGVVNTTQGRNIYIGVNSAQNNAATGTIAIGHESGATMTNGDYNVFLGYESGYYETGDNKLMIGNSRGTSLIYGDFSTGALSLGGTAATSSNRMSITSAGLVGIATATPEAKLDVWGSSGGKIITWFSSAGTKLLDLANDTGLFTWLGTHDFSGATVKIHTYPAFSYATSTAWTGTTTIPLGVAYNAESWTGVKCYTDTGTLNVSFYDGTNRMDLLNASTTVNQITFTTNNTFTASEKRYVDVGTPASTPTKISCTVDKIVNN